MLNFIRNNVIALALTMFVSNSAFCQVELNTNQTYRGLPIVDYPTSIPAQDQIIQEYQLGICIDKRREALGFYRLMENISEPSTVSFFSNYAVNLNNYQKKPFILDADIQVPITLGGKRWVSNNKFLHTLHLIPQFKVRIFQNDEDAPGDPYGIIKGDESRPVRTPSYMPRITWYFSHRNLTQTYIKDNFNRNKSRSNFFGVSLFHHSNGQDGPEFYPKDVDNANAGEINVYNGNFGEEIVFELIYGQVLDFRAADKEPKERKKKNFEKKKIGTSRIISNRDTVSSTFPFNRRRYIRTAIEIHEPDAFTNDEFAEYNLYGRYRLNLQYGYSWMPAVRTLLLGKKNGEDKKHWIQSTPYQSVETWRIVANMQYILDPNYNRGNLNIQESVPYFSLRRLNIYGTAYWTMSKSANSALFAQVGYWGSDNYNIFFQEQIINLKFGIAMAFFKNEEIVDFERNPFR